MNQFIELTEFTLGNQVFINVNNIIKFTPNVNDPNHTTIFTNVLKPDGNLLMIRVKQSCNQVLKLIG